MNAVKCAVLGIIGMLGVLVGRVTPLRVPLADTLYATYRRQALVALLAIVLAVAAALTAMVQLFDPNVLKGPLARWVHERTQRDLVLDGDLKVQYFPRLTLHTGKVALSQRRSAREFAAADDVQLGFAWLPLLRRELQLERIELHGLRVQLMRFKDGSSNVDDLAHDVATLLPLGDELGSLRVERSTLHWNDEMGLGSGSLHDLQLELGPLAEARASPLTASARVAAALGDVDARARLQARLLFDRAVGRAELARVEARLDGRVFGLDNLALELRGDAAGLWRDRSLALADAVVTTTSTSGLAVTRVRLSMPELKWSAQRVAGSDLSAQLDVEHPDRRSTLTAQLPRLDWSDGAPRDTKVQARWTTRTPGGAQGQAQLEAGLRLLLDPNATRLELDAVQLRAEAQHPALAAALNAELSGALSLDLQRRSLVARGQGTLAGTEVRGELSGTVDGSRPRWRLDGELARVDLDRLLAPAWRARWADDAAAFDAALLRDASVQGRLRIGQLKLGGVTASALDAGFELEQSVLSVAPLAARLYGAPVEATLRVEAAGTPRFVSKGSAGGFALRALLDDLQASFWLDGHGSATWDVAGEGSSIGSLRQSLTGTAQFGLRSGRLAGIDLAAALAGAKAPAGQPPVLPAREFDPAASTPLTDFDARIELRSGRALGHAVALGSGAMRAAGEGVLIFDSGLMDLRLLATLAHDAGPAAAGVPLQVQGPWRAPRFGFDVTGALGAAPTAPSAPQAAAAPPSDESGAADARRLAATVR